MAKKKSNMQSAKKVSSSAGRRIQSFPSPYYHRFTMAYSEYTGDSAGRIVCDALKRFVDAIPPQEREKILKLSERTPRQSKNGY